MSREYYLVCDKCRKKVHLGCVGFSGFQCWTGEEKTMLSFGQLLDNCMFHFDKLKFVWEQSIEDEEYEEVTGEINPKEWEK